MSNRRWAPEQFCVLWRGKNLLPLPGLQPLVVKNSGIQTAFHRTLEFCRRFFISLPHFFAQLLPNYVEIKCQLDATYDFYCRSYFLLNMFRAPLCPSSGAREYYTGGCCLWYLVLWFSSCLYDVELRVMCPVCGVRQPANRTHNPQLLMMGIVVSETC
jgi:hypothetical protein